MKIHSINIRLTVPPAGTVYEGDKQATTEIKVFRKFWFLTSDKSSQMLANLDSTKDCVIPSFSDFVKQEITVSTAAGKWQGYIDSVSIGDEGQQVVTVEGAIANGQFEWLTMGLCAFGRWRVEYTDETEVKSHFALCPLSLADYLALRDNVADAFNSISDNIPRQCNCYVKGIIGQLIWLRQSEPELLDLILKAALQPQVNNEAPAEGRISD